MESEVKMNGYKLTKVTELDRVTPKVALAGQNINYDEIVNYGLTPWRVPLSGESASMIILPTVEGYEFGHIRTSAVNKVEETESELIVETRNTVYFFEK